MDFTVKNLWVLDIFGVEVWITETIFNTWLVMLFLIAAAIIIRLLLGKLKEIPTGLQSIVETVIEMINNLIKNTAGEKLAELGHWFFMVFVFIISANFSGMIGLRPPTADWVTTFAMAMGTFILIQAMGVKYRGVKYIKGFFEPNPAFFPLNLIGEMARPVSLSFRLFGNILAGMIILSLVYGLTPMFVRFVIPAALHAYFDVFAGSLHTYIFSVLSLSFIGAAVSEE